MLDLAPGVSPEFVVDRLQLLAQVILALVLVDLLSHPILDPALDRRRLDFGGEVEHHLLEPPHRINDLQQLLSTAHVLDQLRRQQVGEMPGIRRLLHHLQHILGQGAARVTELADQVLHHLDQHAGLGG